MYFMAKQFDEVHIISKERNFKSKDNVPISDELSSNLIVHRIPSNLISSNINVSRVVRECGADIIFADTIKHGTSSLLCKKKYKIPLITFIHGYEADLKAIGLKLRFGMKPAPGLL